MLPCDSAVQQQAQPIVPKVPESVADTQDFLDQEVDGFGGSVADPSGGEVSKEFGAPGADSSGQPA
jgi:hypothetical protein